MSRYADSGDETEDDDGRGYIHSKIHVDYSDKTVVRELVELYEGQNRRLLAEYHQREGVLPGEALAKHGYCVKCLGIRKYMIHHSCEICTKPMCIEHIDLDPECTFIDLNPKDGMFDGYTCCEAHLDEYKTRVSRDTRYSKIRAKFDFTKHHGGGDGVLRPNGGQDIDDMTSAMAHVSVRPSVKRSVRREPHTVMASTKLQPAMPASTKRIIQYRHSRS